MDVLLTTLFSSQSLWVIFSLVIGIWFSISWVLNYHWKSYGANMHVTRRARLVYFIGSLVLLLVVAVLIVTL